MHGASRSTSPSPWPRIRARRTNYCEEAALSACLCATHAYSWRGYADAPDRESTWGARLLSHKIHTVRRRLCGAALSHFDAGELDQHLMTRLAVPAW